jgi:RNA polymerase primary sigma factor
MAHSAGKANNMAAITENASKAILPRKAAKKKNRHGVRRSHPAKGQRRSSHRRKNGAVQGDDRFSAADNHEGMGFAGDAVEYVADMAPGRSVMGDMGAALVTRSAGYRSRRRAEKTGDGHEQASFLAKYFRDMAELDVLRPEEEFTVARHIEEREIVVWEQVFSYPPIVDHLLRVIESHTEQRPVEFRTLRQAATEARRGTKSVLHELATAAQGCAEKLHALDSDRLLLKAVLDEIERIAHRAPRQVATPRLTFSSKSRVFGRYLTNVRNAESKAAEARNRFVQANLRLVVSIARRFNHGRMPLADLIQEGNIGLMKAVDRYDYRRGFRFSTYASWWIRHAISRALADKGREIRLPVHMIDAHHRVTKTRRELAAKLGRQPSNEEIAEATEFPVAKIEQMRGHLLEQAFSLDRPVNDEDGRAFVELIHDPTFEDDAMVESLAMHTLSQEVADAMSELKPIEADILRQRFGLGDDREMTLKEIGQKYNLSRERIRQLQEEALSKVRDVLHRKDITSMML